MIAAQAYEEISQSGKEFDELLMEQLPQVKFIARRIHERLPQHVPFEDLVHAGIVGLIDAMHKYDANKNVRFASYAKFRIRGAILDSLRAMDWSPRDLRRKARRVEELIQQLQGQLGHAPSEPELAQAMDLSLEEFQHLLDEIRGLDLGSLQVESLEDGRETNLADMIAGPERTRSVAHLSGERTQEDAGQGHRAVAAARAAGAGTVLPGRADHEGDRRGAGSGRIAGLADSLAGGGAAAHHSVRNGQGAGGRDVSAFGRK